MDEFSTSGERSLADLVLFGLGFVSFMVLLAGLILAVPCLMAIGLTGFLAIVLCFWMKATFAG